MTLNREKRLIKIMEFNFWYFIDFKTSSQCRYFIFKKFKILVTVDISSFFFFFFTIFEISRHCRFFLRFWNFLILFLIFYINDITEFHDIVYIYADFGTLFHYLYLIDVYHILIICISNKGTQVFDSMYIYELYGTKIGQAN